LWDPPSGGFDPPSGSHAILEMLGVSVRLVNKSLSVPEPGRPPTVSALSSVSNRETYRGTSAVQLRLDR
jgi:hypothetical protein